jgi:hypothetical protein
MRDVKARQRRVEAKKKARQTGDAPSNKKVWQLLCWAFIVAKSTPPKAAPMLDFASLHCANTEIRAQVIHKSLWTDCGWFWEPQNDIDYLGWPALNTAWTAGL